MSTSEELADQHPFCQRDSRTPRKERCRNALADDQAVTPLTTASTFDYVGNDTANVPDTTAGYRDVPAAASGVTAKSTSATITGMHTWDDGHLDSPHQP